MEKAIRELYYFLKRLFCNHDNKFTKRLDYDNRHVWFHCLDCDKDFTKNLDQWYKTSAVICPHDHKYEIRRYYHYKFIIYHCDDCGRNIVEEYK